MENDARELVGTFTTYKDAQKANLYTPSSDQSENTLPFLNEFFAKTSERTVVAEGRPESKQ